MSSESSRSVYIRIQVKIKKEISSCVRVANSSDIQFEIESYVEYSSEWSGYMWLIIEGIEDKIKRDYYDLVSNAEQLTDALLEISSKFLYYLVLHPTE